MSQYLDNFKEWDGLVRLCFTRKNKTLSAIFKQNKLLRVIEENYRRLMEIEGQSVPDDLDIGAVVRNVLQSVDCADRRAMKMSIEDFLKLLDAFASANIRFSALHDKLDVDDVEVPQDVYLSSTMNMSMCSEAHASAAATAAIEAIEM